MLKTQVFWLWSPLLAGFLLTGCSSDEGDTALCEDSDSEVHLDSQLSESGDYSIMLHHVDKTCPVVGNNGFHAYLMDDGMEMKGDFDGIPFGSGGLSITSVDAYMPEHGHGLAEEPTIDADDNSIFTVNFQMPGTWELTLDFTVDGMSGDMDMETQSVVFTLEVEE